MSMKGSTLVHTWNNHRRVWTYLEVVPKHNKFLREHSGLPLAEISQNFKQVMWFHTHSQNEIFSPDADRLVRTFTQKVLPSKDVEDGRARKIEVLRAYTMESGLYRLMNNALRDDLFKQMRYFSAFIQELRDVFLTGGANDVVVPYKGLLWRGVRLKDTKDLEKTYQKDSTFVWPAFTSMSTEKKVAESFGNVTFCIRCGAGQPGVPMYRPAKVSMYSEFPSESEVIFPPNAHFKVLEVQPGKKTLFGLWNTNPVVSCIMVALATTSDQIALLRVPSLRMPEV